MPFAGDLRDSPATSVDILTQGSDGDHPMAMRSISMSRMATNAERHKRRLVPVPPGCRFAACKAARPTPAPLCDEAKYARPLTRCLAGPSRALKRASAFSQRRGDNTGPAGTIVLVN